VKAALLSRGTTKKTRKWARLQLAIPVFVRTNDRNGQDSLEFATAINISAGGAMIVVQRSLPKSATVSLEIPSAPLKAQGKLPSFSRIIRAKAVWVNHFDDYHLMGLKFLRPLTTDEVGPDRRRSGKALGTM